MEALFTSLIVLQFLIVAVHDWINIPGWVSGTQVQEVVGRRKLAWGTAINLLPPGFAVAWAIWFYHAPKPGYVLNYWLIYTAVTVAAALVMWWIPYLFGASAKHRQVYSKMYAGTRHILPVRAGDPGPNLTHIVFHVLFMSTLILAVVLRLRGA